MRTTKEELLKHFDASVAWMRGKMQDKNADYADEAVDDAFANFTHVEHFRVASAYQGFFTRMIDKFSRIATFINRGVLQVKDESVEDTLLDLANYCILLAGLIKRRKAEAAAAAPKAVPAAPAPAPKV